MKIRRSRSLAFQLTVWYIALLGVIVVVSGAVLYQGYRRGLMTDLDRGLLRIAAAAEEAWRHPGVRWEQAFQRAEEQFKSREPWLMVVQLKEPGSAGRPTFTFGPRAGAAFILGDDVYFQAEAREFDHLLFLTVDDRRWGPDPLRIVLFPLYGRVLIQAGLSEAGVRNNLRRLAVLMTLAGLLLLVMASAGGNFILRRAMRPVRDVVGAARRISTDDLSLRLDVPDRSDEIGALVETFNAMLDRLARSVGKIKQFSGDVSHELRTPLTAIRGEVEVLRRKDRTREEVGRTLDSVLEETARMGTIIDNAIRYTPAGGTVELSVRIEGGDGAIVVRDTGVGIPDADRPFIFDRFYVVDPSRSRESGGSGLGLSIVKEVADLHEAAIDLRSRAGEGTTFIVRFHRVE